METLLAIKKRRSIRKYKDKEVPLELLGALVEAGSMAPSAGDNQPWKFIVVRDSGLKEAISVLCNQDWMAKAPAMIVLIVEDEEMRKMFGLRGEKLYSIQTCASAVQNIMLAATDLGLGSCWVGSFDEQDLSRVCRIPTRARPQAIITIGYPDETPQKKVLKPLDRILNLEKYGNDVEDINYFVWDWSAIVEKNVTSAKKTISQLLKKSLEEHRKKLKENWNKVYKNIDSKIKREQL